MYDGVQSGRGIETEDDFKARSVLNGKFLSRHNTMISSHGLVLNTKEKARNRS